MAAAHRLIHEGPHSPAHTQTGYTIYIIGKHISHGKYYKMLSALFGAEIRCACLYFFFLNGLDVWNKLAGLSGI